MTQIGHPLLLLTGCVLDDVVAIPLIGGKQISDLLIDSLVQYRVGLVRVRVFNVHFVLQLNYRLLAVGVLRENNVDFMTFQEPFSQPDSRGCYVFPSNFFRFVSFLESSYLPETKD